MSFGAATVPAFASLPNGDTKIAFRTSNVTGVVVDVWPAQSAWVACTVYTPGASAGVADQVPPAGVMVAE